MMASGYDFIIVGGGTAGCVLAARLSEDPDCSVLLIEAGTARPSPLSAVPLAFPLLANASGMNWTYFGEAEPDAQGRRIPVRMGRGLGGSSLVNGMIWARGHPQDYDEWEGAGARGWSFEDVRPWFSAIEHHWRGAGEWHGGDGPVEVRVPDGPFSILEPLKRAAREQGIELADDPCAPPFEGMARAEFAIDAKGRRVSAARAYLGGVSRPKLQRLTGAVVTRVVLENDRAVGIELIKEGDVRTVRARHEVIISAGTYQSPHLLLLSGIGNADELRAAGVAPLHGLNGVGENLQNHVTVNTLHALETQGSFPSRFRADRLALACLQWLSTGRGALGQVPLAMISQFRSRGELDRPDVQALYSEGSFADRPWFPVLRPHGGLRMMITNALLRPFSRGKLRLASHDPLVRPRLDFGLLSNPGDLRAMCDALALQREIAGCMEREGALGPRSASAPGIPDGDLEDFVRRTAGLSQHPVGTCAMGDGPEAVVDPELRVRGLKGLRVIDASVAPIVPSANTYAMSVMIAERGAAFIAAEHGLSRLFPDYNMQEAARAIS